MAVRLFRICPLLLLLLAASCKKSKESDPAGSGTDTPLLASSTGWERVAWFWRPGDLHGLPGSDGMAAYYIGRRADGMHILYSALTQLSGTASAGEVIKGHWSGGPAAGDTLHTPLRVQPDEFDYVTKYPLIVPGSLSVIALVLNRDAGGDGYVFGLFNEINQVLGSISRYNEEVLGHAQAYADGAVMVGGLNASNEMEVSVYKAGAWQRIYNGGSDSGTLRGYLPLRWDDGTVQGLGVIQRLNGSVSFVLRNADFDAPMAPWPKVFEEARPEWAKPPKVLKIATSGDTATILMGSYAPVSNELTTLSAYRLIRGATTFQTLYANVPVADPADNILDGRVSGQAYRGVALLPDGTAYAGFNQAIRTFDAGGEHILGAFQTGDLSDHDAGYILQALTYMDGYFYAALCPVYINSGSTGASRLEVYRLKR